MDTQSKLLLAAFVLGFSVCCWALVTGPTKPGVTLMRCGVVILSIAGLVFSYGGFDIETDTIRFSAWQRRAIAGFLFFVSGLFLFQACFGRGRFIRELFKETDYHAPLPHGESKVISGADRVRKAESKGHKDE